MVYAIFYSESGLFPASDNIWKISFFIVFLLKNIFIRYSLAEYNFESSFSNERIKEKQTEQYDRRESYEDSTPHNQETYTETSWFAGISSEAELKKRYRDLMKIYHPDNQAGDTNTVQQIQ